MSEELKKLEELLANDRKIIEENYKEIERLTKRLEEAQLGYLAVEEKNKRLHSIIKEVREYIEKHKHLNWYNDSCYMNDLLEILDKAGDEK